MSTVKTVVKPVRVAPVTEKVAGQFYENLSDAMLVRQYINYKEKAKELEESIGRMQETIKSRMRDGVLLTTEGSVETITRRNFSWSMETVKAVLGRQWSSFVQPDAKLLKVRSGIADEIGAALTVSAVVKTSEALIVKEVE